MSDQYPVKPVQNDLAAPNQSSEPQPPVQRDWFLLEFIRLAELGVEQSVTLSVGGSLVTGKVVSGFKFFELMAEEMTRAKELAAGETKIYDSLRQNYEFFRDVVKNNSPEIEDHAIIRDYIHLRDAKILFVNGSMPTKGGVLWRGRVQAVDAFFSGSITTE